MLDNNSNDINELIKKLDNKLVSSNICLNLPSDDIDLDLDLILDFPNNKVNNEKHTIDIKNNEINLEVNKIKDDIKFKSKKETINDLSNEEKINKIDKLENHNDNKSLNEDKINNRNEIIDEKEEENRIIIEEEIRRENEDKEREKEENERRKKEEEKRLKREMERKEIEEKERKEDREKEEEEEKNKKEENKIDEGDEKEKEIKEEKISENSICIQSENSIKPFEKSQSFEKNKNSKLFLSLSEEQKNDYFSILNNIKNIKSSENNNIKDLDADLYPTISLDLEQKEETLDDIIPNFKNIIKQNENEIEKRKHNFISHNYFEWKIETSPLLEFIPDCKISHVDLLKKIYKEEGLHNVPEINDDYEELIFKNQIILENNSPIGNVEDLKSFIYKYNFQKNQKITINSLKSFNFWRNIEGDGNSFYRAFMFSLLEYYILNNNLNEMNEIISEITSNKLLEIYKKQELDYKIPFIIFGAILKLLSNNNIEKAYDIFIKSYLLKNACFDKMLIIYLRYISYIYVDEVIELSKEIESQIQNNINKELINTMNIEPNFFIICLIPYLFDINILIFWLDKDLIQCKDGVINFIDEENSENIPLISVGYFFSSYHIIYSIKSTNEFMNKIFNSKSNNLSRLTCQIKNKDKCQICKGQKYIIFLKQNFKVCKNCLDIYINKISSFRNQSLNNDNYIGQEYYSRPFHLKDNYILNDFEFIEIKEEVNIINYLQHTASIVCSKCKGNFDKKNLNNLKCKCLLCDKCLEEMILYITGGLKILNSFEKRNLKKAVCTSCGGDFSYEDALEHLKDIKEKDRKNAINRMKNYIYTKCLVCGNDVRKNENIDEFLRDNFEETEEDNNINQKNKYIEIKKFKRIKIRKESDKGKGIDYLDNEHVICYECYEKMIIHPNINFSKGSVNNINGKNKEEYDSGSSDDDDNKYKRGEYYIDFEEGECLCFICNKKHYLIDKSVRNGGCCSSGCIIN